MGASRPPARCARASSCPRRWCRSGRPVRRARSRRSMSFRTGWLVDVGVVDGRERDRPRVAGPRLRAAPAERDPARETRERARRLLHVVESTNSMPTGSKARWKYRARRGRGADRGVAASDEREAGDSSTRARPTSSAPFIARRSGRTAAARRARDVDDGEAGRPTASRRSAPEAERPQGLRARERVDQRAACARPPARARASRAGRRARGRSAARAAGSASPGAPPARAGVQHHQPEQRHPDEGPGLQRAPGPRSRTAVGTRAATSPLTAARAGRPLPLRSSSDRRHRQRARDDLLAQLGEHLLTDAWRREPPARRSSAALARGAAPAKPSAGASTSPAGRRFDRDVDDRAERAAARRARLSPPPRARCAATTRKPTPVTRMRAHTSARASRRAGRKIGRSSALRSTAAR